MKPCDAVKTSDIGGNAANPSDLAGGSSNEIQQDLRIAALLEEFETNCRNGEKISLDTFLARNQEVAAPLKECLEGLQLLQTVAAATPSLPASLPPGTVLGDFRIERPLGSGSMGVVYQAQQVSLGRPVALKVLSRSAAAGKLHLERFRREVMAASTLDHPNIVPVYQVGDDLGLHFYAMRKIDGQSLDRTALPDTRGERRENVLKNLRELSTRFAEVAEALDAAHRQGIVHRDLKPSNLIADRSGRIWVVDFGLARHAAIDSLTQSGEIVGTLRYMSPEQARGRSDAIDGRTDVYGIGATLYELLTGVPPFDGFTGIDLLRRIQHTEPPAIRRLNPKIPADFATIVQRAMRPEKTDRYETAAALAADLRRFAAGKPIHAHPVTLAERSRHWTRRNLTVVLATLAISVIGLFATLVHNQRLQAEQSRTRRAAESATRNYGEARRAVDQLGARLAEQLLDFPGTESLRHELLADTLGYYERFVAASENDPQLKLDVAKTRMELARLHRLLGDYVQAERQYTDAVSALQPNRDKHSQLAWTQAVNELAMLLSERGNHPAALRQLEQIAPLKSAVTPPATVIDDRHLFMALTLNNLAIVHARLEHTDDAVGFLRLAILALGSAASSLPDAHVEVNPRLQSQLADALSNLSTLMSEQHREAEALALAQEAVKLRSLLPQTDAAAIQHRAIAQSNLAAILMRSGRTEEAVRSFEIAVERFEQVRGARPHDPLVDVRLAVALNNFAMARYAAKESDDAELLFQKAQAYAETAIRKQPDNPTNYSTAAGIMNNLGVLLRDRVRTSDAREAFEAAIRFQTTASKLSPDNSSNGSQLSQMKSNLATLESVR